MNYLALLQMLQPDWDSRPEHNGRVRRDIAAALVACARKQGYSENEIHQALNSDRCLTIYEP